MISSEMHRDLCKESSLLVWYPKIRDVVPTPDTEIVMLPPRMMEGLFEGYPTSFTKEVESKNRFGYPVFVRTDQMAAKHSWKHTCYVEKQADLGGNLAHLLEENYMVQDWPGEAWARAVVLREFLNLRTFFTAYAGMPVAREFRFFAAGGSIDCWHPYWPHQALAEGHPSERDWRSLLPALQEPPDVEAFKMVTKVSKLFKDQWSIDVCQLGKGTWAVTDMARGEVSFLWKHGSEDGGTEDAVERLKTELS